MSDERWVVNASPLIVLAKVGHLGLLHRPGRELVLPEPVAREILAGPDHDPARQALESGFGGAPVSVDITPAVAEWSLGHGESAVISLALRRMATVMIDDRDARRAAKALGVPLIGTLGVVIRARAEGRIASASEVLRQVSGRGFRLDDALVAEALYSAFGEVWTC
ncbi:MAG: DUF3368 domain-containing protein [Candidatus Schekmanbacteria bacterium]|nr:DUF3368 domain-containing protein [Candidatus Schekmanbacteria bacterium]